MTLGATLDGQLRPGPVQATDQGVTVQAEVADVDRLGVAVHRVRVTGAPGDLSERAAALPDALAGALPERIVPVEVAPELGGAVLRSDPAGLRGGEFYEVTTDGAGATVQRYRVDGHHRRSVPFTLTREQLGHAVDRLGEVFRPRG